jgi:NADPH:quinone reductase-like Zn-dependent oxidoreductase
MRAVQIISLGKPLDVIGFAEVAELAARAAGEVLVGIEFAPVNYNDLSPDNRLLSSCGLVPG